MQIIASFTFMGEHARFLLAQEAACACACESSSERRSSYLVKMKQVDAKILDVLSEEERHKWNSIISSISSNTDGL
jgi:hypothetical protein